MNVCNLSASSTWDNCRYIGHGAWRLELEKHTRERMSQGQRIELLFVLDFNQAIGYRSSSSASNRATVNSTSLVVSISTHLVSGRM